MDIDLILAKMPLEDKARLICGRSPFSVGGMEVCGMDIPVLYMQDGGTGINYEQLFQDRAEFPFPAPRLPACPAAGRAPGPCFLRASKEMR